MGRHLQSKRSSADSAGTLGMPGGANTPSAQAPDAQPGQKSPLLSRRAFLYGAAGLGAAAVVGGGIAVSGVLAGDDSNEIDYLEVPESALTPLTDFEAADNPEDYVHLVSSYDIPFGSLVWVNDEDVAACLLPTETGSPLTQIGLLFLGSGNLQTVQEAAVGKADSFEIYDVRATSSGVIWTEANIMQGAWKIYGAPLENGAMGASRLLDEGDDVYETPTLAAVGSHAFWQKIPRDTQDLQTNSQLMCVSFAGGEAECLYESRRRSATPIYADAESVVITPRLDSSTVYHELTRINAETGEVTDTLILPASMKPLEAGFGKTGFMFSFPDIYNFGDGISNLGTYTPFALPANGDYSSADWFGFARTPTAAPAWADDLLIVKSSYSICGVDLGSRTYFAIDVENGADTYGEYLASTGTRDTFVTYTNIDHTPIGGETVHTCRVKVWAPGAGSGARITTELEPIIETTDDDIYA